MRRLSKTRVIDWIKNGMKDQILAIKEEDLTEEILLAKAKGGIPVALHMLYMGYKFRKPEFLKLVVDRTGMTAGMTVAHYMVFQGHSFDPETQKDILKLAGEGGATVAYIMAIRGRGNHFDPDRHQDILLLKKDDGNTVAHALAIGGYKFDPGRHYHFLVLRNNLGVTVAHEMAKRGYVFDSEKHKHILTLRNEKGETVAHYMARKKHVFDPVKDRDICMLKDYNGKSVLDTFLLENRWDILRGKLDQKLCELSCESLKEYINYIEGCINLGYIAKEIAAHFRCLLDMKKSQEELQSELSNLGLKL